MCSSFLAHSISYERRKKNDIKLHSSPFSHALGLASAIDSMWKFAEIVFLVFVPRNTHGIGQNHRNLSLFCVTFVAIFDIFNGSKWFEFMYRHVTPNTLIHTSYIIMKLPSCTWHSAATEGKVLYQFLFAMNLPNCLQLIIKQYDDPYPRCSHMPQANDRRCRCVLFVPMRL